MLARVAAKASSNGDIKCTDEIIHDYNTVEYGYECATQCDSVGTLCLTRGDMCDSTKCGTCMTCQFTLFNSLPAATAITESDMADKVNAECAIATPMTEPMCDSIGPALLINNPKLQCLINFNEVHEPKMFAEYVACFTMVDSSAQQEAQCTARVDTKYISEIMKCYVLEGFEIQH